MGSEMCIRDSLTHCALVVQKAARMMLARRRRQRLWRKLVLHKIRGVLIVGSVMACELHKRRAAAVQLQRVTRGKCDRMVSIEHNAVRKIQAIFRGLDGRRRIQQERKSVVVCVLLLNDFFRQDDFFKKPEPYYGYKDGNEAGVKELSEEEGRHIVSSKINDILWCGSLSVRHLVLNLAPVAWNTLYPVS